MYILEVLFSISPIIGLALCLFIGFKKEGIGNYKKAKYALMFMVFIYAVYVLDNFLVFKGHVYEVSGIPYTLYHLVGYLLFYFISEITGDKTNVRFWNKILIISTIVRAPFFVYVERNHSDLLLNLDTIKSGPLWYWIILDNILVVIFNLGLILKAYQKFHNTPLVIEFGKKGDLQYRWVNFMFITNIVLMGLTLLNTLLGGLDIYEIQTSIKFDLIIYSLFFFVLIYSLMSFPVFAFTGHYKDLEPAEKKKYNTSTLQDSRDVFQQVDHIIKSKALYLESTLKLNTVAEKTGLSLPHISQAINENTGMSFSDYINAYRIEEAKLKLLEEKPDKIIAIAFDVGFNSKATFYNAFKKFTNTTPTNFIHQNKSKAV